MNKMSAYALTGLLTLTLVTACAKKPDTDIVAARASVDAVIADGAEQYVPEQAQLVGETLQAAMDEIQIQDGKFFKSYDKAKELLTKTKTDAEALRPVVAEAKQQAKADAEAEYTAAQEAIQEAITLISNAPRGKGSMADIEALRSDIKGLEDSLPEVSGMIENEEFLPAREKAAAIKSQADSVSEEIRAAMEKVKSVRRKLS